MSPRPSFAAAIIALASCSTTATIQRVDGPDNEVTIEDSDARGLYVSSSSGRTYRLERNQVGEIDHPGNVTLTVGACLVGLATLIFTSLDHSDGHRAAAPVAAVYGLPGLGLMMSGGYYYLRSKNAAHRFESTLGTPERVASAPAIALPDQPDPWRAPAHLTAARATAPVAPTAAATSAPMVTSPDGGVVANVDGG